MGVNRGRKEIGLNLLRLRKGEKKDELS